MADFNDPFFGKVDDVNKALDALMARIKQADTRVAAVERGAGAAATSPPVGGGRAGSATGGLGASSSSTSTKNATAAARAHANVLQDIERLEAQAAGRTSLYSEELRRQVQLHGTASQALRKHGALTTEFLAEAGKGRVTLGELRYQIGTTIGKFAGWTAAATAVYGMVGALRQVGTGAVEASTGVNQLQRVIIGPGGVDPTAAMEGFRRRSAQFNVPIEDSARAQYQLGKVFGNQDESFRGTEALLYAVKVGELEVDDASKLLISTINAFGLTVDDLMPLMDRYNALQNQMGVATRDTAAGVAKASGQWRAAGGSIEYLSAVVGAGTKVTGLSGDQFGTLLQRSSGLVNRPVNRQALRGFGIDPEQNIEQIIRDAFKVAPTLPRDQLVKLAEALSTPQLAPRFTALLGRPDMVARAERIQAGSAGASERELAVVLKGFAERMSRISNDLQQIGEGVAVSGGLALPGAALTGLDHGLRLVAELGRLFSGLNPEMRAAVATIAQLTVLMALLRRFNVGDSFAAAMPQTAGLFQQRPEKRARGLVSSAMEREVTFFNDERERVSRQAAVAQRRAVAAAAGAEAIVARGSGAFGGDEKKYRNALAAQNRQVLHADELAVGLANEEAALRGELAVAQARSNAYQAEVISGQKTALAFAAENNMVLPPNAGLPTIDPLIDPNARRQGARPARQVGRREYMTANAAAWLTQERKWNAAVSDTRVYQAAEAAGLAGISATSRAAAAVGRTGGVIREVGRGVASLGASLLAGLASPMGLLLTATLGLPLAIEWLNERNRQIEEAVDRTRDKRVKPINTRDLPREAREAEKRAKDQGGIVDQFTGWAFQGSQHERLQASEAKTARELRARALRAREQEAFGEPVTGLGLDEINRRRDRAIAGLRGRSKGASRTERNEILERILKEYDSSLGALSGDQDRIDKVRASAARARAEFAAMDSAPTRDIYAGMGIEDISRRVESYLDIARSGRNVDKNLAAAAVALQTARTALGPSSSPEQIQAVSALQDQIAGGINDAAKSELERSLAFAKTGGQRRAAYARYTDTLRRQLVTNPRRGVTDARKALERTETALAAAEDTADRSTTVDRTSGARRFSAGDMQKAAANVRSLRAQRAGRRRALTVAEQVEDVFAKFFREFAATASKDAKDLEEQKFQEESALAQARADVDGHALNAGAPRTQFLLQRIGSQVNRAIARFGRNNAVTLGLIQQQQQLQDQLAADQEAEADARDQLAVAGARTPAERSARQLDALRAKLGRYQGNRGAHSAADLIGVQAEIRNAEREYAEQLLSDARDLINAQAAYAGAGTDDPVELARIEAQRTGKILRKGGFKTPAERLNARADKRRADRNVTRTREQDAYDDIQFLADVGKITRDEERRRLQRLLKTIKTNKDLKRTILRDLHSLDQEDEGSLDLNIGSMRLPTLYDVRRLARQGAGTSVQQSNQYTFHIDRNTDLDAFAGHLDRVTGGHSRAAMRSAIPGMAA